MVVMEQVRQELIIKVAVVAEQQEQVKIQQHQELLMMVMEDQEHQTILQVQQHFMLVVVLVMVKTQVAMVVVEVVMLEHPMDQTQQLPQQHILQLLIQVVVVQDITQQEQVDQEL
tara:strand:+ start:154 stop:498 length:345 start_codon:yes stop_codon:yes gene_type:complete